jgi:hypothetical protein
MTDLDIDPVNELADISPSYPVIVEYTHQHIVWVEAESPEQAVAYLEDAPHEETSDQKTLQSFGYTVKQPERWDWSDVYDYSDGPYSTLADAHVQVHEAEMRRQKLEAERAACTAAGHPNTEPPIWDGRIWCKGCTTYLKPVTIKTTEVL